MSTELTNNDFRRIFDNFEKEKKEKENDALLKEEKKLKRKQKYLIKKKKNEEKNENQKYRDRAEERRKGILKDVKDESVLYNNINNTIDESKFMGGDEEHTHLVKGLDFLLLNKVRNKLIDKISSEKEKMKINNINKYITSGENVLTNRSLSLSSTTSFINEESKYIFKYFFLFEHPHHIHFKDKINGIYENIINNMKFKNYNKNIHSVNYKYNIDMDIDQNDIPIKYIYNVDHIKNHHTYYLKNSFLNEIGECFKWHMENKKKKKSERLSRRPLTNNFSDPNLVSQVQAEDDDIDIFKIDDKDINETDIINTNKSEIDDKNNIKTATQNEIKDIIFKDSKEDISRSIKENKDNYLNYNMKQFLSGKNISKSNNQDKENEKNSLTKNIFKDTYDECYPGYG